MNGGDDALLRLCLRPRPDDAALDELARLAQAGVDWLWLTRRLDGHGLLPLAWRNLQAAGAAVPPELMQALARRFRAAAGHNLFLAGELLRLVQALEREGVEAMPLKGPVLALTAFGDLALREYCDLDLLIREADLERARALLAGLGLREVFKSEWLRPYLHFGHELQYEHPRQGVAVDLQWRFGKRWLAFPLQPQALWRRAVTLPFAGTRVRQPCPEDYLLLLCGHAYRHCWSRLKWVVDVSAYVEARTAEIDWRALPARAEAEGGRRVLGLGLWLARELCATRLPSAVDAWIDDDSRIGRLGGELAARLVTTLPRDAHGDLRPLAKLRFHLQARERLRDKLPRPVPLMQHATYIGRRYARHYYRKAFG